MAILIFGVAGVLFVIAAFMFWTQTADFQRRATDLIEAAVEGQTGEEATLNGVEFHFIRPGISLHGFHLWHKVTGDTIVSAERIHVPIYLLGGSIGRLRITHPFIQLHLGKDGKLREFRNMKKGNNQGLKQLPWRSLQIEDGIVQLYLPDGQVEIKELTTRPVRGPVTDLHAILRVQYKDFEDQTALDWTAISIGPDRITVPDLKIDFAALNLRGAVDVPFQDDLSVVVTGHSELEEVNDLLKAPRALYGTLDFDAQVSGSPQAPQVHLSAMGTAVRYEAPGALTPVLTYDLGDITAAVKADKESVTLERAELRIGEGFARVWGSVHPEPTPGDGKPIWRIDEGYVVTKDLSLADILRASSAAPSPWVDLNTDGEMTLTGTVQPLELAGPFELVTSEIFVADRPVDNPEALANLSIAKASAIGTFTIDKRHAVFKATEVITPLSNGSMTIDVGFKPKGPLDLSFNLNRVNLRDFAPLGGARLRGVGSVSGKIWGPFNKLQFSGFGDLHNFGVTGIEYADHLVGPIRSPDMKSVILENVKAIKGKTSYSGNVKLDFSPPMSLDTDVVVSDGRIEDLASMFLELPGLTGEIEGELSLSGPMNDLDGEAHLYTKNVDLFGEVFDEGQAHGYMDQGLFTLDDMRFTRRGGEEGLILRGSVGRKYALNMELLADLSLDGLTYLDGMDLPVTGHLTSVTRISNTLFEPAPTGRLLLTEMKYGGRPIDDSILSFFTRDGILQFHSNLIGDHVSLNGSFGLWGKQPYAIAAHFDRFPAHVFYPVAADGQDISAVASGQLKLSGHLGDNPTPIDIQAKLSQVEVAWGQHTLSNPLPWSYTQVGATWSLENLSLQGGKTALHVAANGGNQRMNIEGGGNADLDLLRAIVPGLMRADGNAKIDLYGSPGQDGLNIEVRVDAPLIQHSGFPAMLEDVETSINATHDSIIIEHFAANLGGGHLRGSARKDPQMFDRLPANSDLYPLGIIDAENWSPVRFNLMGLGEDCQVRWTEALAPAVGNASIQFDGPVDSLLLSGEVEVVEMVFTDRLNWQDWVIELGDNLLAEAPPTDEEAMFSLDVHITADKTVRLANNVVSAVASTDLRVVGDTSRPGMLGWIQIHDGEVYVQDREFKVERGYIAFRDPWTWDPDLDLDLMTDLDSQRHRYRVNFRIVGPYSNWTTLTSSDPPLPQSDINALLWFGVTADELEDMGELGTAVGQAALQLLVQDFFQADYFGVLGFKDQLPQDLIPEMELASGPNLRGEYSSDLRVLMKQKVSRNIDAKFEFNLARADHNARAEWRIAPSLSLSGWYATRRREGIRLPIVPGALGTDLLWLYEFNQ